MSNLNMTFDPSTVDPNGPEPFAVGDYMLHAIESTVKPTQDGKGTILAMTYEVLDAGPNNKRRVYDNINIANGNAQAQQIGQKQLSALCHACGSFGPVSNSEQLHFKPFKATIGIEPASGKYRAKNVVQRYIFAPTNAPASTPGVTTVAPAVAAAQAAAVAGTPWAKTA